MNKNIIGFVLLHLDGRQSEEIIESLRHLMNVRPDLNILIFNSYNNIDTKNIPVLHINQAKFFRGDLFVFDIVGLMISVSSYCAKNIYYYAQNIPWMTDTSTKFSFWSELLENDRVKIIAQTPDIATIYSNIWKNPTAVLGDLNPNELCKIL